jgi:hypothetical protein
MLLCKNETRRAKKRGEMRQQASVYSAMHVGQAGSTAQRISVAPSVRLAIASE